MRWLGFDWGEHLYFASDYFEQLYEWAVDLIRAGKAYVDDLERRRDPRAPRHVHRAGHARARGATGRPRRTSTCSRACAPASSPTARACCARRSTWPRPTSICATPCCTASCTRSTRAPATPGASTPCTTSLTASPTPSRASPTPSARWSSRRTGRSTTGSSRTCRCRRAPHQYEFARLNLTYTVLSKRVLLRLVNEGVVRGWDDPRMPTLSGLRRRGFPAEAIRDFATLVGVAKTDSVVEVEHARARRAQRAQPRRRPAASACSTRSRWSSRTTPRARSRRWTCPTTRRTRPRARARCRSRRELWIERDDFMEEPVRKFFRLAPGREVRLRSAYFVTCNEVVKDADGRIVELRCTLRSGDARRRRARRPPPQGHPPLGLGRARRAGRGAALRPSLHGPVPGRRRPRHLRDLNPDSENVLRRLLRGAVAAGRACRRDRAVRAARLLLPRPGLGAGRAGLQPHADAQGHVGQAAGAGAAGHG